MRKLIIVVTELEDWANLYPSDDVMTVHDYLAGTAVGLHDPNHVRVINLCRSQKYLSYGYYCSLLAEARGHRVLPSVRTLNDLRRRSIYSLDTESLDEAVESALEAYASPDARSLELILHFGSTTVEPLQDIASQIFDLFPCPILKVHFKKRKSWGIASVTTGSLEKLDEASEEEFGMALERFSTRMWLEPRARTTYRYDVAMLVDPNEKLAPSDPDALLRFERVGKDMGLLIERVRKRDFGRLAEYDALFIRETTAINHHTFRFAKRAENEGMVVIDDPGSILRCTNKLFLWDLLKTKGVPAPRAAMLYRTRPESLTQVAEELSFPVVVKIPDGAFSQGIELAEDMASLHKVTKKLFERSALLLAQEFMLTEYDWRIGVLNRQPLYACKYFMAPSHWQIYNHGAASTDDTGGGFETLPISAVPANVLEAAMSAANLIGDGLYGVDVKQVGERAVVIEVNDNPSIDEGVEDAVLGDELYARVLGDIVRRLDEKRAGERS
ncbi:MAG: RimK family protein [Myxococcales bacterium]|nr:RimK family protein [Myxococcales bacterium]